VTAPSSAGAGAGAKDPPSFAEREAEARRRHADALDAVADDRDGWRARNAYYYRQIEALCRFVVPAGARVLEIGCGTGDLLAGLSPAEGAGIDLSPRMIARARDKHPGLSFFVADAETMEVPELAGQTFDYVVMSDVVGQLRDVWAALRAVRRFCNARTRLLVTYYNFAWEPILRVGARLGLKMPVAQQNWLGMNDLRNLLELNHFEVVRAGTANLLPVDIPGVSWLCNTYLAEAPLLRHLALTQFFVARLADGGEPIAARDYRCTVVVPCRNERGNVDDIVARTPQMGRGTELIFVDGNSSDGTVEAIERHRAGPGADHIRLLHQGEGTGKGDAVRKGFAAASGDVLFILDADLTVPPEDLPKFYTALAEGRGEFINGTRLVYPMEGAAMRFLNLLGNKFFSVALSAILAQRLKDTLCGTKVLLRRDYQRIVEGRAFFGDFDPFGDFDLLFGAAKQSLKIVEMPIRYRDRTYGETKISRFRHGWLLLRMTWFAFRKFR
jgi:SAM-dependent methyltransferase/GT2 family glycosyltransferase